MANQDLKLSPHNPKDKRWWWYEEPAGISVYYRADGGRVDHLTIPWESIRSALGRKDK